MAGKWNPSHPAFWQVTPIVSMCSYRGINQFFPIWIPPHGMGALLLLEQLHSYLVKCSNSQVFDRLIGKNPTFTKQRTHKSQPFTCKTTWDWMEKPLKLYEQKGLVNHGLIHASQYECYYQFSYVTWVQDAGDNAELAHPKNFGCGGVKRIFFYYYFLIV